METDQGKWLTRQQVAGRWNVSVDTVKRLDRSLPEHAHDSERGKGCFGSTGVE